jgi:hypothetical protein
MPRMYQTINMYHTKHQLCTTTSASIVHQHLYQIVHQPCTNTCTKPCINHAPQPLPYASTIKQVHENHTKYQSCTIPCINHVHKHLYHTMYLNHVPYYSIIAYTIYHRIYQASIINGVPQPSTNITKRCISYTCFHIPSVFLNNVSISMKTIHHVSMLQEYAKNKPQAYSIITM